MDSEESGEDNNEGGDGDSIKQHIDEGETRIIDDKDIDTMSERLEDLEHDAILACQDISKYKPGFASQLLSDHSRLLETSAQLTKEAKKGNLNVIVQACIAAMVRLLNIYTHNDFKYS